MRPILPALSSIFILSLFGCSGGSSSGSGGNGTPPPVAPTISSTSPAGAATGVAVNATVSAIFSEAMSASSLTATTFTVVASGGGPVTGTVVYNAATLTATFTPSAKLAYSTQYIATITTGAASASGTAMTASHAWTFTTAGVIIATATIDFGTAYQVIRGFGGSEAWSGPMPSTQIATLYGNSASTDLGLSIMRVRIAPTTWTASSQTADTSAWTAELQNAKAAQALGALVFATPWTAPASMKSNNSLNEGSLSASSYADFANYLEAYVNYASNQGVNLYAISMQNEPDWDPCGSGGPTASSCYESCLWTAAQMDTWVANNSSVLSTRLMMPESFYFNSAMSDTSLNDPSAADRVAIVGGHLYGGTPYYYTLAESLKKDVWMTEHTVNLASGETTSQSIADALSAATEIHNSMTVGQYNAYVYWWMANSTSLRYYSGLLDTNDNMTYFGAAMAQFARFVRPGYTRFGATASPVSGVYVSAYGGSGRYVIVAINTNASDVSQTFAIQNQTITTLTPYQTAASSQVAQQTAINVTGNQFTYTLPAQSITTFEQ